MKEQSIRLFAEDGAWCFFADPRALYYEGEHSRTYVGWLNSVGDVRFGSYDHASGRVESVTIRSALQQDDHANPTLHIDAAGHVTIYYSAHNGKTMYYRRMERAEDIASFGEEKELPVNTDGRHGYTYPNPIYLTEEGRFYLFWRGGNFKPNFSTTVDPEGGEWSPVRTLMMDSGQRPYTRFVSNGRDAIHFSCTDGHPNVEPHNSIYYARYRDGGFYRADGSAIRTIDELPLQLSELDVVFDGRSAGRNAWIWDIALDDEEHPVIVYVVFASLRDHRYCYSRWNGERWVTNEIVAGGPWFPQTAEGQVEREPYYSGGIILDHENPSVVYVSRQVNGVFEIERRQTSDLGATWSHEAITSGSSAHQVRPFLSWGGGPGKAMLLWMSGEYRHYTDYRTSLRAWLPEV